MRFKKPRGAHLWVSLATIAGIGTLIGALGLTSDGLADWLAGVLVNLGASVVLILPAYLLTKRLDDRIEQVGSETKSSVQALADRVETFEHEVERRIDDVAASVASRLEEEQRADVAAFQALGSAPSRAAVVQALRRADDLALISKVRGPRVCVSENHRLFVQIRYDDNPDYFSGEEEINFTLESYDGAPLDVVPWPEEDDVETVMVKVGRALQRRTSGQQLDVKALFDGMSETLAVAQTDPERRPIWQLCPPQWAITERGILTYGRAPHYGASTEALAHNSDLQHHISQKPWVDADSLDAAVGVVLAMHRRREKDWEGPF